MIRYVRCRCSADLIVSTLWTRFTCGRCHYLITRTAEASDDDR